MLIGVVSQAKHREAIPMMKTDNQKERRDAEPSRYLKKQRMNVVPTRYSPLERFIAKRAIRQVIPTSWAGIEGEK